MICAVALEVAGSVGISVQTESCFNSEIMNSSSTLDLTPSQGGVPVRIVYAPSDGSVDRASSLDSEEKHLFDELQRELMDLKRYMRQQDQDASRKVGSAQLPVWA